MGVTRIQAVGLDVLEFTRWGLSQSLPLALMCCWHFDTSPPMALCHFFNWGFQQFWQTIPRRQMRLWSVSEPQYLLVSYEYAQFIGIWQTDRCTNQPQSVPMLVIPEPLLTTHTDAHMGRVTVTVELQTSSTLLCGSGTEWHAWTDRDENGRRDRTWWTEVNRCHTTMCHLGDVKSNQQVV